MDREAWAPEGRSADDLIAFLPTLYRYLKENNLVLLKDSEKKVHNKQEKLEKIDASIRAGFVDSCLKSLFRLIAK